MLLDMRKAENIDASYFPVPEKDSGVVRRYKAGKIYIKTHRRPSYRAENAFVLIEWSCAVWHNGKCLFAANLQRDDLRALSGHLGISVRSLQEDYGVKDFYGPLMIELYSSSSKESLGEYYGSKDEDEVVSFLLGLVLDTFDEPSDPVRLPD